MQIKGLVKALLLFPLLFLDDINSARRWSHHQNVYPRHHGFLPVLNKQPRVISQGAQILRRPDLLFITIWPLFVDWSDAISAPCLAFRAALAQLTQIAINETLSLINTM